MYNLEILEKGCEELGSHSVTRRKTSLSDSTNIL